MRKAVEESHAAAEAVASHLERVAEEETTTFSGLLGRPASAETLRRVQGRFEKAAGDEAYLRHAQGEAMAAEADERRVLEEAWERHRLRHRSVEKLDSLFKRLRSRDQRRRLAFEELAAEEDAGLKGRPSVEPGSRKA